MALDPIWMLCVKYFPVVFKLRYLPYRLGDWSRCKHLGWTFSEDYHLHEEYGPIFTIVTPSRNEVIIGDHDAAHIITSRRRDFVKPAEMYSE